MQSLNHNIIITFPRHFFMTDNVAPVTLKTPVTQLPAAHSYVTRLHWTHSSLFCMVTVFFLNFLSC